MANDFDSCEPMLKRYSTPEALAIATPRRFSRRNAACSVSVCPLATLIRWMLDNGKSSVLLEFLAFTKVRAVAAADTGLPMLGEDYTVIEHKREA